MSLQTFRIPPRTEIKLTAWSFEIEDKLDPFIFEKKIKSFFFDGTKQVIP